MRLLRYALGLQGYSFIVYYKKGTSHTNVDPPSRAPLPVDHPANLPLSPPVLGDPLSDLEPEEFDEKRIISDVVASIFPGVVDLDSCLSVPESDVPFGSLEIVPPEAMVKIQNDDPSIRLFFDMLDEKETVRPPTSLEVSMLDHMFRDQHGRLWYRFFPRDNVQHRHSRPLLVLPTNMRDLHIDLAHNGGSSMHEGPAITTEKLLRYCWWPRLISQVRERLLSCDPCQRRKRHTKKSGEVVVMDSPSQHTREWIFDFSGHLPRTKDGNEYVAMITDRHSGVIHIRAVPANTAVYAVRFLYDVITRYHDQPELVRTDEGSNVTSKLMSEVLALLQSEHKITLAYVHDASGPIERKFRVLWDKLSKVLGGDMTSWDKYMAAFQGAVLHAISSTRGETPFRILYGRDPISLPEMSLGIKLSSDESKEMAKLMDVQRKLLEGFTLVNVHEYRRKMADKLNRKRNKTVFKPGERVLVDVQARVKTQFKDHGAHVSPKLNRNLAIGPFRVVHQDGQRVFLRSLNGIDLRRAVHAKRVFYWFDAEPLMAGNASNVEFIPTPGDESPNELVDIANEFYLPRGLVHKFIDPSPKFGPTPTVSEIPLRDGGSVSNSTVVVPSELSPTLPKSTPVPSDLDSDPSSDNPTFDTNVENRFVPIAESRNSFQTSTATKAFWNNMPSNEASGRGLREKRAVKPGSGRR